MVYFSEQTSLKQSDFDKLLDEFSNCGPNGQKLKKHELKITVDMIQVTHNTIHTYYDEEIDEEEVGYDSHVMYFGLEKTYFNPSGRIKFLPEDAIVVQVDGSKPPIKEQEQRIEELNWNRSYKARVERERFKGTIRKFEEKIFSYKQISLEEIADYFYKLSMKAVYLMEPKDREEYFRLKRREQAERQKKYERKHRKSIPIPEPGRVLPSKGNYNVFDF